LMSKQEVRDSVVVVDAGSDHLREFRADWWPSVDPRVLQLAGISIQKNDDNTADVDAVEFVLSDLFQTALLFAYYHVDGQLPTGNGTGLTNVNAAAFAFALRVFGIFEFVDGNGQPGFQNGTADILTGFYDLSSAFLQWKPMDIERSNVTVNGTTFNVFTITIETLDNVFLLRFIACGYPVQVEGVKINPESIKVDLQVNYFNNPLYTGQTLFATGPSPAVLAPTAQVGLFMAMAAAAETIHTSTNPATQNPVVNFQAGGYTGFFEWAPNANVTVQGYEAEGAVIETLQAVNNSDVQAAFEAGWIIQIMYFVFSGARPDSVAWDPTLGTKMVTPSTTGGFSNSASASPIQFVVVYACFFVSFFLANIL